MKKKILLFFGIIFLIFVGLIAYLVVVDLKQEDLLKQEIINFSNKDLLKSDYSIEVKTTGDYAYVEEAVKKFYKELSDNVKIMNVYMNDEKFISILSADNLVTDRPNFIRSHQVLETARKNITEAIGEITNLCEEETLKNLIDKDKVDEYYYDLYLQLMYTEKDLGTFKEIKTEMEELSNNLNLFLDKVKEILNFLEKNNSSWEVISGQIYFKTNDLVNEYNRLYQELNTMATEKFFTSSNDDSSSQV